MKQIYIGKSNIAGRGILAAEDIKKGEFITTLHGKLHIRHYKNKSEYRNEQTWIPVALHRWVSPIFPFQYLNHSCEPSAGFKTPRRLYAFHDIKKGEEISVDYSTIEYVDFWDIKCTCGAAKCRKVIRAVQHLPTQKFKKYLPYIPRFLQKVYRENHKKVRI